MVSVLLQKQFAEEAIRWADLKVPYRHRGETDKGCDCTGLIIGILTKLNKLRNYKRVKYKYDWNIHAGASDIITEELLKIGDFVIDNPEVGDIFLFKFGKCNSHTGIIINDNTFIHSTGGANGYCRRAILKNSQWSSRLVGVIRLNEEKLSKLS